MTIEKIKFWRYAIGGVLSDDGVYQVWGRDRFSYNFRKKGELAILPCEHFEDSGKPSVAFDLKTPIKFVGVAGGRDASKTERDEIQIILKEAIPLIERQVIFD